MPNRIPRTTLLAALFCALLCACGKNEPGKQPPASEETKAQVKSALLTAHKDMFYAEMNLYGIVMPPEAQDRGLHKATYKKTETEALLYRLPKSAPESYAADFRKAITSAKKLIPLDQEETTLALPGESEMQGITVSGADTRRNQAIHIFIERDRSAKQKFNRPYQTVAVIFLPIEVR